MSLKKWERLGKIANLRSIQSQDNVQEWRQVLALDRAVPVVSAAAVLVVAVVAHLACCGWMNCRALRPLISK
jgi:hypothetical protein